MPTKSRWTHVGPLRAGRGLLVGLVVGLVAQAAFAQEPPYWRFYSSLEGLPESWIADVTVGPSGRVFIAHGDIRSMSVYDGRRFTTLPSPGSNLSVREAPDGRLWALVPESSAWYRYRGLQVFDGAKWKQYPDGTGDRQVLARRAFLPWAGGRVLVVTPGHLLEFEEAAGRARALATAGSFGLGEFLACEPAASGGAWVAATGGLLHLAASGAVDRTWRFPGRTGDARTATIAEGTDGRVFVGLGDGRDPSRVLLFKDGRVSVVAERPAGDDVRLEGWPGVDGAWWLATIRSSTFDLSEHTSSGARSIPRVGILSGQWMSVTPDGKGGMWIATALGLARHTPAAWRRPASLPDPTLPAGPILQTRRGDIVVARDGQLLSSRDGLAWRASAFPPGVSLAVYNPYTMVELSDGRIAVGFSPGHWFFDPANGEFQPAPLPAGATTSVVAGPTRAGGAWLVANAGREPAWIEALGPASGTVRIDGGSRWKVSAPRIVFETSTGDIYVVPDGAGISRFHNGVLEFLDPAHGYPGNGPFAGAEVAPGRYWFGDRDALLEFDGSRWREVRRGLKTVRSILVASDRTVWVSSGSGLHRYRDGSWLTFTAEDGLPDGGVAAVLEDRQGRLWATTTGGLSLYHPEADADPPDTGIDPAANPREVAPYGQVHTSFWGLDRWGLTRTERLLFSWRVDDGAWTPFQADTNATTPSQSAGSHRFQVRAMDRNGNIDATPAVFEFEVLRPWYLATGFLLVGIPTLLLVGGSVGLLVTRYLRLERLVDERTRALRREADERREAESRFHQAQKLEAVGRLAGGVAHDFNNVLTVIAGCSELLSDDVPSSDPRRPLVDEIQKAATRAASMTRQLLAFGRHQVTRPDTLDLNGVVQDISRMLRRLIGEDVSLEFSPAPDLWPVVADRGQIEQVLVNLAVNARDAMPGGGRLVITLENVRVDDDCRRLHADARPGPCVRLSVSDDGTGMDPDTASRVFEPFFTTKAPGSGTGLGLSVVYGIVHRAGGWIDVETSPGHGTTFRIHLPRSEAARAEGGADEPTSPVPRGSATVLVTEDDAAVRSLAAAGLRRLGYTVLEAASAEDAEGCLDAADGAVDLLLTDIVMTGRSGIALAERVHARWPAIRVLFMSGYANRTVTGGDLPARDVPFLQKPFTAESLGRKVRETLDR